MSVTFAVEDEIRNARSAESESEMMKARKDENVSVE